jgi:hypothetical protein
MPTPDVASDPRANAAERSTLEFGQRLRPPIAPRAYSSLTSSRSRPIATSTSLRRAAEAPATASDTAASVAGSEGSSSRLRIPTVFRTSRSTVVPSGADLTTLSITCQRVA